MLTKYRQKREGKGLGKVQRQRGRGVGVEERQIEERDNKSMKWEGQPQSHTGQL